jgi:hypothetical protein
MLRNIEDSRVKWAVINSGKKELYERYSSLNNLECIQIVMPHCLLACLLVSLPRTKYAALKLYVRLSTYYNKKMCKTRGLKYIGFPTVSCFGLSTPRWF